jgi:hypothetical protein
MRSERPPISAHMRYLACQDGPPILPVMRYLLSRKSPHCRKQNAGSRTLARGQTDSGLDVIVEVGVHQDRACSTGARTEAGTRLNDCPILVAGARPANQISGFDSACVL